MFSKRILNILLILNLPYFIISAPLTSDDATCPNLSGTNEPLIDYNVVLKTDATNYDSVVKNHFEMLEKCLQRERHNVHELDFSSIKDNNNVIFDFSVKGMIAGYTTKFTKSFVENYLSKLNDVAIVNENKVIEDPFENEVFKQAPLVRRAERPADKMPNLDRIDQENFPLDLKYIYPDSAGAGVDVFVVDSGIFLEHEEFQGRQGKTIVEKTFCNNPADDNGHGTNVASLVGGKTLGVASNANIIGVKITGNDCPLTSQNIINGITYVMQQKANDPGRKIVLNLSATSIDSAVGDAASKAVEAGIHFVVGAGNRNLDACGFFPGKVETVVTVTASKITTNQQDWITDWCNWGKCVTLFAPGENVPVAGIGNPSEIKLESGTSLSAPHVSGAIALMLANGDFTPEQSKAELLRIATKDKIQGLEYRPTANVLLRVPSP
ncbi:unnamed protein product [Rhizophagus irregularis]|nr:unnamed protein product [Rhizophagus irregularis]